MISTAADWGGSDGGSRQPAGDSACCQQDPAGTNQTPGVAGIAVQAAILSRRLAAYLDHHKPSAHGEPLPTLLAGDFNSLWRKIASDAFDEVDLLSLFSVLGHSATIVTMTEPEMHLAFVVHAAH